MHYTSAIELSGNLREKSHPFFGLNYQAQKALQKAEETVTHSVAAVRAERRVTSMNLSQLKEKHRKQSKRMSEAIAESDARVTDLTKTLRLAAQSAFKREAVSSSRLCSMRSKSETIERKHVQLEEAMDEVARLKKQLDHETWAHTEKVFELKTVNDNHILKLEALRGEAEASIV